MGRCLMKQHPKKTPKTTRFDKITNFIVQKSSPSHDPMSVEDEHDAIEKADKKTKLKSVDLPGRALK